jgi:hypothetical protein
VPADPMAIFRECGLQKETSVQLGIAGRSFDCFFVVNSTAFKGTARKGLRFAVLAFRAFGFWSLITVPHINSVFDSERL